MVGAEEQQTLLQRQVQSAQKFSSQIAFAMKQEADSIVAAARVEEEAVRSKTAQLQREQAQSEAAHLERLREREAAHLERQRQREADHEARVAQLQEQGLASLAKRQRDFEAACAQKQARLQTLAVKEEEIQARVAAMQALVAADGQDAFVQIFVGGRTFETTIGCLTRFPHSVLAALWHEHGSKGDTGPLRVNGDPSHFHLILRHLLNPEKFPVVSDVSQIQWLEREGEYYRLDDLVLQCRDAYKRLDTVRVMQLLNGQRNLSGMDMRSLNLSDIDFRGASMYRARVDEANLSDAMLSGPETNLRHASFCRMLAPRAVFSHAQMSSAQFVRAILTEAVFEDVEAAKADFGKAELGGANFSNAKLRETSFVEASAPRAVFSKAQMESAKLGGSSLMAAVFEDVEASHADLSNCDLSEANFRKANLSNANLSGANMQECTMIDANLSGANLEGAILPAWDSGLLAGVKLKGARGWMPASKDLSGATLTRADLSGCDLSDVNLSGANLMYANLEGANVEGAILPAWGSDLMAGVRLSRVCVPGSRDTLQHTLKVGRPAVFALTATRALRLLTVRVDNGRQLNGRGCKELDAGNLAKRMEVRTGPSEAGPWTSVFEFFQVPAVDKLDYSRWTRHCETFAVPADAPLLTGYVQVAVHETHRHGSCDCVVWEIDLGGLSFGSDGL